MISVQMVEVYTPNTWGENFMKTDRNFLKMGKMTGIDKKAWPLFELF